MHLRCSTGSANLPCESESHVSPVAPPRLRRSAVCAIGRMSEHMLCVLDDHTQIKLRKYSSTRFVAPGQAVSCLSLANIEVDPQFRRKGHARRSLLALRRAAADNNQVLIVESASCQPRTWNISSCVSHTRSPRRAAQTSSPITCMPSSRSSTELRCRAADLAREAATIGCRQGQAKPLKTLPPPRDKFAIGASIAALTHDA